MSLCLLTIGHHQKPICYEMFRGHLLARPSAGGNTWTAKVSLGLDNHQIYKRAGKSTFSFPRHISATLFLTL